MAKASVISALICSPCCLESPKSRSINPLDCGQVAMAKPCMIRPTDKSFCKHLIQHNIINLIWARPVAPEEALLLEQVLFPSLAPARVAPPALVEEE